MQRVWQSKAMCLAHTGWEAYAWAFCYVFTARLAKKIHVELTEGKRVAHMYAESGSCFGGLRVIQKPAWRASRMSLKQAWVRGRPVAEHPRLRRADADGQAAGAQHALR